VGSYGNGGRFGWFCSEKTSIPKINTQYRAFRIQFFAVESNNLEKKIATEHAVYLEKFPNLSEPKRICGQY